MLVKNIIRILIYVSLISGMNFMKNVTEDNKQSNININNNNNNEILKNIAFENGSVLLSEMFSKNDDFKNESEISKIITQREVVHHPETEIKFIKDDIRLFLPPDISIILNAMSELEDAMCREHVLETIHALHNRETWAMQMLDSSAKFPSGILVGSYYQLGNYDECTAVRYSETDHEIPKIKGQYCLGEVQPIIEVKMELNVMQKKISRTEENSTLHWAICVPHSCKPKEVKTILDFVLNGAIGSSNSVNVNVDANMCHFNQDIPYTTQEIIYGYVITSFISVILIATFYHVVMYYQKKKDDKMPSGRMMDIILSFSIVHNVQKMLHVGKTELNLNCICGIKLLSMVLIIVAHSLLFLTSGPVVNEDFFKQALQKIENSIFLNNPLLVDTYLLLSGFLMCRLVLLALDKRKGKLNFIVLYIFRYMRLTPVYLVVIGFYCTWFIRIDQGPLWTNRIADERDRCIDSWWANVLYINNYVNVDRLCMFQSWYLAVDTQLFMLAPIIVYPLWRWKKTGEILLGTSIIVSVLIPCIVTYWNNLDPTLMLYAPEIRDLLNNFYFINAYIKTHMRANSYCLGLALGYIIHRIESSKYKFPKIGLILGWIFSCVFMLASIFSIMIFYNSDYEYNKVEAAAYSTLHRVLWCLGVGWIMIACITGNGGSVQRFLCWKPFIPLSRITYCAYLVNGLVELHGYGTIRSPRYMSAYHLACDSLSHLVLTFSLAFVVCILFESPIHGLEKIIIRKEMNSSNQNQESNEA